MSDLPSPGDLAYIVREYSGCQENIGFVVKVCDDQRTLPGYSPLDPGEVWITCNQPLAAIYSDFTKSYASPGERVAHERAWLRRIAGPSTPTETTTDLEVTA